MLLSGEMDGFVLIRTRNSISCVSGCLREHVCGVARGLGRTAVRRRLRPPDFPPGVPGSLEVCKWAHSRPGGQRTPELGAQRSGTESWRPCRAWASLARGLSIVVSLRALAKRPGAVGAASRLSLSSHLADAMKGLIVRGRGDRPRVQVRFRGHLGFVELTSLSTTVKRRHLAEQPSAAWPMGT